MNKSNLIIKLKTTMMGDRRTGFTIIELLVSIFIIVLISGVFMVNFHNTSKRSELNVVKQKLASDIRVAQNNSLGAKSYDALNNTPVGGWGVHFNSTSPSNYIIFADIDGDKAYTYTPDEAIETKALPAGVEISLIEVDDVTTPEVDIVFLPPDPVTYINTSSSSKARIELKENINNSTSTVMVNFFGLIDTE